MARFSVKLAGLESIFVKSTSGNKFNYTRERKTSLWRTEQNAFLKGQNEGCGLLRVAVECSSFQLGH